MKRRRKGRNEKQHTQESNQSYAVTFYFYLLRLLPTVPIVLN